METDRLQGTNYCSPCLTVLMGAQDPCQSGVWVGQSVRL